MAWAAWPVTARMPFLGHDDRILGRTMVRERDASGRARDETKVSHGHGW
jgi:hypothetical protein